jgi:hypothetical protein
MIKQSQKLLLNLGSSISIYVTAKDIRNGVSQVYEINAACQKALCALEGMRNTDGIKPVGLEGVWEGHNVQLNIVN